MSTQILPYLSLVIPAYNEARRLPNTLQELYDYCRRWARSFEVIIVVESSTDETLALALFEAERDLQIIVGNRQHPNSQIIRHQSWMREGMGKTFNALVRWLAGIEIRDTQCGFKGFRQAASRAIFERQRTDGFSFDVEVLLLAKALGFGVKEMPVHWSNSPDSKVRVVSDSLKMLRDVAVVRRLVRRTLAEQPYV